MRAFAAVALLAILGLTATRLPGLRNRRDAGQPGGQTTLIPWAWERRENLQFLGEGHTVAWYAGIITLRGDRVVVEPRRNPLVLPARTHRIAVVRIETHHPALDDAQLRETVAAIARLFRNAEELQIDFDAAKSERAFYRELLFAIRKEIDAPLTITALASWCMDDRWLAGAPVDEAIPMLFRMGKHAQIQPIREPLCMQSVGISLDEPRDSLPRVRRVWVFNPNEWTEKAWNAAGRAASR